MSSYGSMSPGGGGGDGDLSPSYDRYEPQFFCTPQQMQQTAGSPLAGGGGGGAYWPDPEPAEYEPRDLYHDAAHAHYIGRNYGYDEVQMTPPNSDPYGDPYQHHGLMMQQNIQNNNVVLECEQLGFARTAAPPHTYVRVVKRRNTANKKERRRTQSINTAFSDLRECIPNVPVDTKLSKKERRRTQNVNTAFSDLRERIPNVPADTKLSKIKTLRLATSYISYLMRVLECDAEPAGGFRAELHHPPARRQRHHTPQRQHLEVSSGEECKRSKGRTGWPQHVWALELKQEQNMQA